ncbi:MAG: hypothetical protein KDB68_03595 [Planctomycetes bacterium]|nr:hypothetical protein [Planctomycetota bacterium]MCA8935265.1 hypothetical protein [Planctomycetota bacterium]
MKRWTLSAICLLVLFTLSACGSGNVPAENTPAPAANNSGDAKANTPDDTPKEDPDKWKKVVIPTPTGWDKLPKDGQAELRSDKFDLLLKPSGDFFLLDSFSDKASPHASSGTDEEWKEWRETVSAVFIYNASKTKDSPTETLKKHGGAFIKDFDSSKVGEVSGFAVYMHPSAQDKWLACTSNERGTYILCALVRNEDASKLMKPYPGTIKPE